MKKPALLSILAALSLGTTTGSAAVFQVDLSPAGGALNLGSTTYTQDHAVGIAALNTVGQPASSATGNEIAAGITFDDVTNTLSFDIAYGSAFGFADLAGNYTTAHFHGPSAVNFPAQNTGAGVMLGIDGFHTASGSKSGRFTGSVILSDVNEVDLFDNEVYLNIHSAFAGGGEIRGQLIVVPEPATSLLSVLGVMLMLRRRP